MYVCTWYICVAYTCVLYAHMCAYVDICACIQDAEEDAMHLLYYFVPYSFNSYYICAGNQAWLLWKSKKYSLTDESSLQAHTLSFILFILWVLRLQAQLLMFAKKMFLTTNQFPQPLPMHTMVKMKDEWEKQVFLTACSLLHIVVRSLCISVNSASVYNIYCHIPIQVCR